MITLTGLDFIAKRIAKRCSEIRPLIESNNLEKLFSFAGELFSFAGELFSFAGEFFSVFISL